MPMNRAVKNTKMYACNAATSNSSKFKKNAPTTLLNVIVIHKPSAPRAVIRINSMIMANAECPPNMLANKRMAKTPFLIRLPPISMTNTRKFIPKETPQIGMSRCGHMDFQDHVFRQHLVAADLENLLVDDVLDGIRRAFAMLSGPSRVIRQCEPSKHQTADDSDPPSNSHH